MKESKNSFQQLAERYSGGGSIATIKIKDWYTKNYPTDDLGEEINGVNTFEDLWNEIHKMDINDVTDIYDVIGVIDSLVRERLFEHLSKIKGVEYRYIYDKWLESDVFYQGGGVGKPFIKEVTYEELKKAEMEDNGEKGWRDLEIDGKKVIKVQITKKYKKDGNTLDEGKSKKELGKYESNFPYNVDIELMTIDDIPKSSEHTHWQSTSFYFLLDPDYNVEIAYYGLSSVLGVEIQFKEDRPKWFSVAEFVENFIGKDEINKRKKINSTNERYANLLRYAQVDSWKYAKGGTSTTSQEYYEGGGMWQIKNSADKYYSLNMQSGKPVWNESPDLGYSFAKDEAEIIKNKLGDNDLQVVKYDPNWWKMSDGGEVSLWKIGVGKAEKIKTGSSRAIKGFLTKNKSEYSGKGFGIQSWPSDATEEEVSRYNNRSQGSATSQEYAPGGKVTTRVEKKWRGDRDGKDIYYDTNAAWTENYGTMNDQGSAVTSGISKVFRKGTGEDEVKYYKKNKDFKIIREEKDKNGNTWLIDFLDISDDLKNTISFQLGDLYDEGGAIAIVGKRIKLIRMTDPYPVEPGTMGTITSIDGIGQIQVNWDNGRTLAVIPGEDEYEILEDAKHYEGGDIEAYENYIVELKKGSETRRLGILAHNQQEAVSKAKKMTGKGYSIVAIRFAEGGKLIQSARITELPTEPFDGMPMPKVFVTVDGKEEYLFEYYPDELTFSEKEFVGLTTDQARTLKFEKDKKFLQGDSYAGGGKPKKTESDKMPQYLTTINYEDDGKTVTWGTKTNRGRETILNKSESDIKEEIQYLKEMIIIGEIEYKNANEQYNKVKDIGSPKMYKQVADALSNLKMVERSLYVNKNILLPFFEKNINSLEQTETKIYAVLRTSMGVLEDIEVSNTNVDEAMAEFQAIGINIPSGARITFQSQPYYYAEGGGLGESIHLYNNQPGHDKEYHMTIIKTGMNFTVVSKWGRRGSNLRETVKTVFNIEDAQKIFNKLKREKLAEGYIEKGGGESVPNPVPAPAPAPAPAPFVPVTDWGGDFVEMVNGEWVKIEKRTTPYKRSDKYSNKIYKVD